MDGPHKISVLISTYRGFGALTLPLTSLINQFRVFEDFELVLVDNGCDFRSEVEALQTPFPVTYTYLEHDKKTYMACAARNAGLNLCTGRLVFFMHDNATLVGDDYLLRLWRSSGHGDNGVATKKVLRDGDKVVEAKGFFAHQDAVPREYLKQVGGFDVKYDGDHGYDDVDLYNRLIQAGCQFEFNWDLVSHKLRPSDPIYIAASGQRNLQMYMSRWGCMPGF